MKKLLTSLMTAILAVGFSGSVYAAEPLTATPPGHPDVTKTEPAPAKVKKHTKKTKKHHKKAVQPKPAENVPAQPGGAGAVK